MQLLQQIKTTWTGLKDVLVTALAILILLAFGGFIAYLLNQISSDETEWTRAVFIFGGVEAVAFAAAGYLFGRDVNRARADKAEKERDEAASQMTKAQTEKAEAMGRRDLYKRALELGRESAEATLQQIEAHDRQVRARLPSPAGTLGFRAMVEADPSVQGGEALIEMSDLEEARKSASRLLGAAGPPADVANVVDACLDYAWPRIARSCAFRVCCCRVANSDAGTMARTGQ